MHIANSTEEDNVQYTCVAVNNGGRITSTAELYVIEKENIKRPEIFTKLQGPTFKINDTLHTSNLYSPIKSLNESDKFSESFPYVTTASLSASSYDHWNEPFNTKEPDQIKSASPELTSKKFSDFLNKFVYFNLL